MFIMAVGVSFNMKVFADIYLNVKKTRLSSWVSFSSLITSDGSVMDRLFLMLTRFASGRLQSS